MFLTFVNDLPSYISQGLIVLFADDTTVIVCAKTYESLNTKIVNLCENLHEWFSSNGLILNMSKSNVILFTGRPVPKPLCLNCPVPLVHQCRFLGFTIDQNLNWKSHIQVLCDKLSSAVYALRKLRPLVSTDVLRQTYFAYFHSLIAYGTILWANSTDANRVFIVQKRAVRILSGTKPRNTCRSHFAKHGILTVFSQYIYDVVLYVRQNVSLFQVRGRNRELRNTGRLQLVPRRTALAEINPRIVGPSIYERLPASLREISDDKTFRRRLKDFLLESEFYSIDEFLK